MTWYYVTYVYLESGQIRIAYAVVPEERPISAGVIADWVGQMRKAPGQSVTILSWQKLED